MTLLQQQASDPTASVWVSASAGTGKTKVLTDRVLRLLLQGVEPSKILCLTYTKAAAAEMALRIHKELSKWVMAEEEQLREQLARLTGEAPTDALCMHARKLFLSVLDSPEGLRIQTIHSFCQSLMRRFPLEAEVPPHFKVMDDRDREVLLKEARLRILTHSMEASDPFFTNALRYITSQLHESGLQELFAAVLESRAKLEMLWRRYGSEEEVVAAIYAGLGVLYGTSEISILESACQKPALDEERLREAARLLLTGKVTDQRRGEKLAQFLTLPIEKRIRQWSSYQECFLTQKEEPLKNLLTKDLAEKDPVSDAVLKREQARVLSVIEQQRSVRIALLTEHLLYVASRWIREYQHLKRAKSLLDYEDLILKARELLHRPGLSEWIRYKLDGGLEHILVDEAQDTSPVQWEIIHAVCEEFFSGESKNDKERTLFVVGDEKQSIFSFQGAHPQSFHDMHVLFKGKVQSASYQFHSITLATSFRSTAAVLRVVDAVCKLPFMQEAISRSKEITEHLPHRKGAGGVVEIWPLVKVKHHQLPKEEGWQLPVSHKKIHDPKKKTAELIAITIERWLTEKKQLPARGRAIRAGDIMILVRRRDSFIEHLVSALKERQVPVAGVDRLMLRDHLAVMDLLVFGQFLLLPEDDLTLATLLRSPFIGFTEEQLFTLAYDRGEKTLWQRLKEMKHDSPAYQEAYSYLSDYLAMVDYCTPFELYSHVLDIGDGRKQLVARLGAEVNDPLSEFLALTHQYAGSHPPSLQGFLQWMESSDIEIKRDMEQGKDQVRIMTVHGSKGLQAPIVLLPDTMQESARTPTLFWNKDGLVFWPGRARNMNQLCERLKELHKAKEKEEYWRLLYVALTRAEDKLIVTGWETKKQGAEESWYYAIRKALTDIAESQPFTWPDNLQDIDTENTLDMLRVITQQEQKVAEVATVQSETLEPLDILPEWLLSPAKAEAALPTPLTPSRFPEEEEPAVDSPLGVKTAESGNWQKKRGQILHQLLQYLPSVSSDQRSKAAAFILQQAEDKLPYEIQQEIIDEILKIFEDPQLYTLFDTHSRSEVPLTGIITLHEGNPVVVSGRIDRLVVKENSIWIIDYKTHRKSPEKEEDISIAYVKQMAAYRALLKEIYPLHEVRCFLLWTEGPKWMEVAAERMDTALKVKKTLRDMEAV